MKTKQDYKKATEFLEVVLNGNMNTHSLTSYAIAEIMEIYHQNELKAMKEDKSEYPKLMYVGDDSIAIKTNKKNKQESLVFYKDEFGYWAYDGHEGEGAETATRWKYAQDIEETPEPKKEIIDIAINEDILKYAIIKINGKEVEYKK